jgi:6-phosphogluconolactonase
MKEIIVSPDTSKLAAEKFVEIAKDSIEKRGRFTVALSGGSTPKRMYKLLKSEQFRHQIDWKKVFFFFGDERNVLPDEAESNFQMANENLFESLQVPDYHSFKWKDTNIIRWNTELKDTQKIAEDYETAIYVFFTLDEVEKFPRFDLIFLGMGADGHTASLFPETDALKEDKRIAVENFVPKFGTYRLTFTFPTINNARNIIFLISGQDKAETLREVLHGEFQPEKLPSQMVKPIDGNLLILTDIEL